MAQTHGPSSNSAFLPVPSTSAGPGGGAAAAAASAGAGASTSTAPATGTGSSRVCEACRTTHAGLYGSGRFCGVGCARRQGARRKWSVTPKARRVKRERAPCESCGRMHDGDYASGRFCSVNCARRQAAAQKWSKSRAERSRRLDAIRPSTPTAPEVPQGVPQQAPLVLPFQPVCACACGMVYGPHQQQHPTHGPLLQRTPPPIVYAPALAIPWSPAHAHPLAHAPVQVYLHAPRPAAAMQQLAKTPVTPPSPPRSSSPRRRTMDQRTAEGDASEALLCLGAGNRIADFAPTYSPTH